MNRPGPHEMLLGNRAVTLALLGTGFLALYMSATAGVSWLCPILLFLVGHRAARARVKVVEYRAWSRAWGDIAGKPQQRPARSRPRLLSRGWALGLSVWGVTFAWLYGHVSEASTDNFRYIGVSFLALTVLGARRLLRLLKASPGRARLASSPGSKGWPVVRVLLPVPRSAPGPDFTIDLPGYCRGLLAPPHAAAASSSRQPSTGEHA